MPRPSSDPNAPAAPFLKWAGGKRAVLPALLPLLGGTAGAYHEPFVGGGAVFFALSGMRPRAFRRAEVADLNLRLVRTWRAVRDDPAGLVARLEEHAARHGLEHFLEVRARNPDACPDDAEVGAWMIYLNRAAFNGLYRVNSSGAFNVPFGRYAATSICHAPTLLRASRALRDVEIRHQPFTAVATRAVAGDLVYFDPPYVPLSATASFTAYTAERFGPDDQRLLRDLALELADRGVRVVVSNHDTAEIRSLYADGFDLHTVGVKRLINSRGDRRGAVAEIIAVAPAERRSARRAPAPPGARP